MEFKFASCIPSQEERRAFVIASLRGTSPAALGDVYDGIKAAESVYDAHFRFRCNEPFCPTIMSLQRDQRNSLEAHSSDGRRPGFPTQEDMNRHQVQDHTDHHLGRSYTMLLGNVRVSCACGATHYISEEDESLREYHYPSARLTHLREVLAYNPKAKISDEDRRRLDEPYGRASSAPRTSEGPEAGEGVPRSQDWSV